MAGLRQFNEFMAEVRVRLSFLQLLHWPEKDRSDHRCTQRHTSYVCPYVQVGEQFATILLLPSPERLLWGGSGLQGGSSPSGKGELAFKGHLIECPHYTRCKNNPQSLFLLLTNLISRFRGRSAQGEKSLYSQRRIKHISKVTQATHQISTSQPKGTAPA